MKSSISQISLAVKMISDARFHVAFEKKMIST